MAKHKVARCRRQMAGSGVAVGLLFAGAMGCGDPGITVDPGTEPPPSEVKQPPLSPSTAPPPPISGGTLLVTQDDATVVAADPDRDVVWLVDAAAKSLRARTVLAKGAEPGRIVEDQDHYVHVALRRSGEIAKIDPKTGSIVSQRKVCAAPRGLAYDQASDNLYVACAGGELLTMKARGGAPIRTVVLDRDLRDVVVKGDRLLVSRFRSAEILEVDSSGAVLGRLLPRSTTNLPGPNSPMPSTSSPTVAWRMAALPGGGAVMLHQRSTNGTLSTRMGGYGGGQCKLGGAAAPALSVISGGGGASSLGAGAQLAVGALLVDVAVSRDGQTLAMISPTEGSSAIAGPRNGQSFGTISVVKMGELTPSDPCSFPRVNAGVIDAPTEPVAAAYDGRGKLWVQSRNPAQVHVMTDGAGASTVTFAGAESRTDEGHRLFHTATSAGIACASCHPEAGDDAHVWTFEGFGPRRTPILRGGLLSTAPFHWDGDMTDLSKLMTDVFTGRMSGPPVTAKQAESVGKWLDAQPALPHSPAADLAQVARGKTIFEDPAVGCATCHSGKSLTNNQSMDVGTGKSFQVPSLVDLASRAPYMHSGCANSLRDRFTADCGGSKHGLTGSLSSAQLNDLVAYLETL